MEARLPRRRTAIGLGAGLSGSAGGRHQVCGAQVRHCTANLSLVTSTPNLRFRPVSLWSRAAYSPAPWRGLVSQSGVLQRSQVHASCTRVRLGPNPASLLCPKTQSSVHPKSLVLESLVSAHTGYSRTLLCAAAARCARHRGCSDRVAKSPSWNQQSSRGLRATQHAN